MAGWHIKFSELSAVLIFITGGMNFTLGLGWGSFSCVLYTTHYCFSWFIGVIIGDIIVTPFILRTYIRYIMLFSAVLVLFSGVLTISLPCDYEWILATRYINGVAVGCCTVAFLSSTSELSLRNQRGFWLSAEQQSFSFGIMIVIIIQVSWSFAVHMPLNQAYGIVYILLAGLAIVSALFYSESPVFYIYHNNMDAALETTQDIVGSSANSNVIQSNALHNAQQYVDYNKDITFMDFSEYWPAFIKLLVYRSLVALTFTLPMNETVQFAGFMLLGRKNVVVDILYAFLRFLATSCGLLCIFDNVHRHLIILCSLIAMSATTLTMAIFYMNASNYFYIGSTYTGVICGLCCAFQFCSGFYVPLSSVYLSEAFPMTIKAYLIAGCVIIEQLISIIIILAYSNTYENFTLFCYVICVIFLLSYVFFGTTIPDTRKIPLIQAQQRFNNGVFKICW